ncbi:hypothetical protein ABLN97_00380 [Mycobacterium tuberculosis]
MLTGRNGAGKSTTLQAIAGSPHRRQDESRSPESTSPTWHRLPGGGNRRGAPLQRPGASQEPSAKQPGSAGPCG